MRRARNWLELLAALPWPIGVVCAVLVWIIGRLLLPAALAASGNRHLAALAPHIDRGAFDALLWLLSLASIGAAIASAATARRRRRLPDQQRDLATLRSLSWRDFEHLLAEAYRRQGWQVEHTGGKGPDGGIDLVLRRNAETRLVQCKQWRNQRVGAPIVREQYGLLVHHRADGINIVTTSGFTDEARAFAANKSIELIAGPELLTLIRSVQAGPASPDQNGSEQTASAKAAPITTCPECGAATVERVARRSGDRFLGCARFPACRRTVTIGEGRAGG